MDLKTLRYQKMLGLPVTAWAVAGWILHALPMQSRRIGIGLMMTTPATIRAEIGATSLEAVHRALEALHERQVIVWSPMRNGGSGVLFVVGSVTRDRHRLETLGSAIVVATFPDCPAREAAQAEIDASCPRAAVEAPTPPPEPRAPTADVVRRRRRAA